ncbi:MAG: hypothetical protein U0797_16385 [Gemmataceae bacterium]
MEPQDVQTLAGCYALTAALSVLFLLAGRAVLRLTLPVEAGQTYPLSFRNGGGYFVGVTSFLLLFVALARATGSARWGLGLALGALVAASAAELLSGEGRPGRRQRLAFAASFALLVAAFTLTNATCWVKVNPDYLDPTLMSHSGSIHAGRYGNYAVFIADHDRVPYLAQNVGQSILASCHLMLGLRAPLAALMAWLPFTLAALACLLFGLFRHAGLSPRWSASGAFFVLFCNIALSLVYILVLDNGSPLGFAGYTDVLAAAATAVLAAVWLRALPPAPRPWRLALLPVLLAAGWCWYAPQNVLVGGLAFAVAGLAKARREGGLARLATEGALFAAAAVAAGSQLGPFLPRGQREDIGAKVFEPRPEVYFHPYTQHVFSLWTDRHYGVSDRDVDYQASAAPSQRPAQLWLRRLALFETHLWTSLRLYGFLVLGLAAMAWRLRAGDAGLSVWFTLGLVCFGTGFAVAFGLVLGGHKWWLTRFLVPATALCLTGLVLAVAPRGRGSPARAAAFAALVLAGTAGPLVELGRTFRQKWAGPNRPLMLRSLAGVARVKGRLAEAVAPPTGTVKNDPARR